MNKVIGIHQPNFMPWIGYFHKIVQSDVFVLFDDVQFPRGKSFVNRVEVKSNTGVQWLTVPVRDKGELKNINEIEIASDSSWRRKMLKSIQIFYSKTPFFKLYFPILEEVISETEENLYLLNRKLIVRLCEALNIQTEILVSSVLTKNLPAVSGMLKIAQIIQQTEGNSYLSGSGEGSMRHMDEEWYNQNGIELLWHTFKPFQYPQLHGEFIPKLSIIDAIFNVGPETTDLLKKLPIK